MRVLVARSDAPLATDVLARAGFWVWTGAPLDHEEDAVLTAERRLPWRTPNGTTVGELADGAAEALTAAGVAYDLVGMTVDRVQRPSWRRVAGLAEADVDEYVLVDPPGHERRELERVARRRGVPVGSLSTVRVLDRNLTAPMDLLRLVVGNRIAVAYLALVTLVVAAAVAWRTSLEGPLELVAVALFMGAVFGLFALRRQHGPAFLRPLLVQLATILPLFTAVLIGVIYYFYAAFYEPFGVTPAEVGLTTQAMLSRQGLFIAAWLVVIVALTLTVYGVLWSVHPLLGVERRLDVLQATLLPLIVAIMVLTVLAGTFERGGELVAAARAGRPYDAFAAWFWWPQVREVEVVTADPGLGEGARLIYLGQADGVSVFYDLRRQSTVRLRDVRQIRDRAPP